MTQELVKATTELTVAIWNAKGCLDSKWHVKVKKKQKVTRQLEDQLLKLNIEAIGREDGRQISLSTFQINSLDPRITIAWCMNMNMPLEKIYNKSQRVKFAWAIDITN
ncbi:DNA topoisomerase 1-like [Conger conger]|uniref:DNA topoisomerase 1-like n=1 Tax=Conger conger TaxID=82655 RepID=UPI002A5AA757|nr:DNA topoisomerase 1-like [Conger conger]